MKTPFLSFVVEKYLELVAIIRLAYPDYCFWLVRQEFEVICLGQEMTFIKDTLFKMLNSVIVDVD